MQADIATAEQCRLLYENMDRLKAMAPWQWMAETDVFGFQRPDTAELGVLGVMGMAGEHYALAVYRGAHGIHGFQHIQKQGPNLRREDMLEVPHLQASFEDREMLKQSALGAVRKVRGATL